MGVPPFYFASGEGALLPRSAATDLVRFRFGHKRVWVWALCSMGCFVIKRSRILHHLSKKTKLSNNNPNHGGRATPWVLGRQLPPPPMAPFMAQKNDEWRSAP